MAEIDAELTNEIETLATTGSVTSELTKLLEKKQNVEQKLATLERQIYALEGSYLQDTRNIGNILTGWDSYLSSRGSGALKRPQKFKESDRLFSLSSLTSVKSNDGKAEKSYEKEESGSNIASPVEKSYSSEEEEVTSSRPIKQLKTTKNKGPGRPRKNKLANNTNSTHDEDEFLDV